MRLGGAAARPGESVRQRLGGAADAAAPRVRGAAGGDRKSTRLNSSHSQISYAVFCLKKKKKYHPYVYPDPESKLNLGAFTQLVFASGLPLSTCLMYSITFRTCLYCSIDCPSATIVSI